MPSDCIEDHQGTPQSGHYKTVPHNRQWWGKLGNKCKLYIIVINYEFFYELIVLRIRQANQLL